MGRILRTIQHRCTKVNGGWATSISSRPIIWGGQSHSQESVLRTKLRVIRLGAAFAVSRCESAWEDGQHMRRRTFVALVTGVLLVVATTLWPSPAAAQMRRGRIIVTGGYLYGPLAYGPFWGPYPYYGAVPMRASGDVRVLASPKQAEVYVDGFYAGVVDNFDGVFQRLHATPGGHAITLHFEGYRTVTHNIYVTPAVTFKLRLTMEKLGPGETSDPPPIPARSLARGPVPLPAPPVSPGT